MYFIKISTTNVVLVIPLRINEEVNVYDCRHTQDDRYDDVYMHKQAQLFDENSYEIPPKIG
jgi:hypothetical protein